MNILALYTKRTLPLLRRVLAPFSVLAKRNHRFSFLQVAQFDYALTAGYDLTVLANWVLSDEEYATLEQALKRQGHASIVYDLSDPDLLQMPAVLKTLSLCRLITVPNEYLRKEVKIAVPGARVFVLPSVIDIDWMMKDNRAKPQPAMIGCFGPYDWYLLKEPLEQLSQQERKITVLGDRYSEPVLKELVTPVEITMETYPLLLRSCTFGLCPLEHYRGQDRIWEQEYGMLYTPVLSLAKEHVRRSDLWAEKIQEYLAHPTLRAQDGKAAYERAQGYSAVRLAHEYLDVYREMLPHLLATRYTY